MVTVILIAIVVIYFVGVYVRRKAIRAIFGTFLVLFVFVGCAITPQPIPVNVSAELKKIVLNPVNGAVEANSGMCLGFQGGNFLSYITIIGPSVMVGYYIQEGSSMVSGYVVDIEGDGIPDKWEEDFMGVQKSATREEINEFYRNYLDIVHVLIDTGVFVGQDV